MSLDLFDYAAARAARDIGVATAAAHSPVFSVAAVAAIERVARRQIHVHVDDVMPECKAEPNHFNAWGGAWAHAIRLGFIQRTNQVRPSKDPRKRAHLYPVYFSLLFDPRSS